VKFVVMIFFRHIKLSSGLIGKDVKPREKFHREQLFGEQFQDVEAPYLPPVGPPMGQATSWGSTQEVIPPTALFVALFMGPSRCLEPGFFPLVVMIDCTLLSGLVLARMEFPCDSAQACFSTGRVHENSTKKAKSKGRLR
jgi:hypothetical protein